MYVKIDKNRIRKLREEANMFQSDITYARTIDFMRSIADAENKLILDIVSTLEDAVVTDGVKETRGKWLNLVDGNGIPQTNFYVCSKCGRTINCTYENLCQYPYCHCGAKNAHDIIEKLESKFDEGDICIYSFGDENKSLAIVEIVRITNREKEIANIKFLRVIEDDTGNNFFTYLHKTGGTMNASFKYLKNVISHESEK